MKQSIETILDEECYANKCIRVEMNRIRTSLQECGCNRIAFKFCVKTFWMIRKDIMEMVRQMWCRALSNDEIFDVHVSAQKTRQQFRRMQFRIMSMSRTLSIVLTAHFVELDAKITLMFFTKHWSLCGSKSHLGELQ